MRRLSAEFAAACQARDPVRMGDLNSGFHALIGASCGNKFISGAYGTLLMDSQRLAHLAFADAPLQGEDEEEYYGELEPTA